MKILIVGAGALGGYFGGRLLRAGRQVTFLVRPRRAQQLAATGGLAILSPTGDFTIPNPPLVTADRLDQTYDLIFLTAKAFDIESCLTDIAPAVGPGTVILPVLNGMRHIDLLAGRFGREQVLGGRAAIFAALDAEGRILHQQPLHLVGYGELGADKNTPRVQAVHQAMSGAGFDAVLSTDILQEMWEKWVFISAMAGATCLLRATIGDIAKAGASPLVLALCRESSAIAGLNGFAPRSDNFAFYQKVLTDPASFQASSMLKDVEKGARIESDQLIADLLARAPAGSADAYPLLSLALKHLRCYEARRDRLAGR